MEKLKKLPLASPLLLIVRFRSLIFAFPLKNWVNKLQVFIKCDFSLSNEQSCLFDIVGSILFFSLKKNDDYFFIGRGINISWMLGFENVHFLIFDICGIYYIEYVDSGVLLVLLLMIKLGIHLSFRSYLV